MAGLGSFYFEHRNSLSAQTLKNPDGNHFFLQVLVQGGLDPLYMFDTRPMAMTKANLQVNYNQEDPFVWEGSNGVSTLAAASVRPLLAYRQDFSILNGVVMATNFDGHDQNMNFFLAGNAFGGEYFVPHLNQENLFLDGLLSGSPIASLNNMAKVVPLSPTAAKNLILKLKAHSGFNFQTEWNSHLFQRFLSNSKGSGRFSRANGQMAESFSQAFALGETLRGIDLNGDDPEMPSEEIRFVSLMARLFRAGVAKSATLVLETKVGVDTHDPDSAKKSVKLALDVTEKLSKILKGLKETELRPGQSLMDVTTFVVGSEFGRTMRQEGRAITDSGTDHNPLNNSLLIGGRGIRSGYVVGSSDFTSPSESLSGAHMHLDPRKMKTMGRPFDCSRLISRQDLPEEYREGDYLHVASVINTLYSRFKVPSPYYRNLARNSPPAPILESLML